MLHDPHVGEHFLMVRLVIWMVIQLKDKKKKNMKKKTMDTDES